LFFYLNINPVQQKTAKQHLKEFDYLGLFCIIGGVASLLVGFNKGETNWNTAEAIACLVAGCVLLIAAAINENYTKQSPIVSPRLFHTRTTAFILISVFLHATTFFAGAFYLPLYYQILGASATMAGVRTLPYSLGSSFSSAFSGILLSRLGRYRLILTVAWAVFCIGTGTMILLDANSSVAEQTLTTLVSGIGLGCLFQTPLIALQAAMPVSELATSTAAFGLLRTVGGSTGISVGAAVYASTLRKRLTGIGGYTIDTGSSGSLLSQNPKALQQISPSSLRASVVNAFAKSISSIWLVSTPLIGVGFILVLFIRTYTLQRKTIQRTASGDAAKQTKETVDEPINNSSEVPPSSDTTPPAGRDEEEAVEAPSAALSSGKI